MTEQRNDDVHERALLAWAKDFPSMQVRSKDSCLPNDLPSKTSRGSTDDILRITPVVTSADVVRPIETTEIAELSAANPDSAAAKVLQFGMALQPGEDTWAKWKAE